MGRSSVLRGPCSGRWQTAVPFYPCVVACALPAIPGTVARTANATTILPMNCESHLAILHPQASSRRAGVHQNLAMVGTPFPWKVPFLHSRLNTCLAGWFTTSDSRCCDKWISHEIHLPQNGLYSPPGEQDLRAIGRVTRPSRALPVPSELRGFDAFPSRGAWVMAPFAGGEANRSPTAVVVHDDDAAGLDVGPVDAVPRAARIVGEVRGRVVPPPTRRGGRSDGQRRR